MFETRETYTRKVSTPYNIIRVRFVMSLCLRARLLVVDDDDKGEIGKVSEARVSHRRDCQGFCRNYWSLLSVFWWLHHTPSILFAHTDGQQSLLMNGTRYYYYRDIHIKRADERSIAKRTQPVSIRFHWEHLFCASCTRANQHRHQHSMNNNKNQPQTHKTTFSNTTSSTQTLSHLHTPNTYNTSNRIIKQHLKVFISATVTSTTLSTKKK